MPKGKRSSGQKPHPLSRNEREYYGGETGPSALQELIRCPSCRDNELSPPTPEDPQLPYGRQMGFRATFGCEEPGCVNGWIPAVGKQRLDPYMIAKKG